MVVVKRKLRLPGSPALLQFKAEQEIARRQVRRSFQNVLSEFKQREVVSSLRTSISENKPFQMSVHRVDKDLGLERFVSELVKLDKKLTLTIGGVSYVMNDINGERLMKFIMNKLAPNEEHGSDRTLVASYKKLTGDVVVKRFIPVHKRRRYHGAFFPYTHNTSFDLTRYGVFATGEKQNHKDTCLITALRNGGLEENIIERLKMIVKNRNIPLSKLKDICEIAKIQIVLKRENNKLDKYGKQFSRVFNIGLIEDHYFLIEDTDITSFAIENYEEVKHLENFNKIALKQGSYYKRYDNRGINSFKVILLLKQFGLLTEMTIEDKIASSGQYYDSVSTEIRSLEYDEERDMIPIVNKGDDPNKIKYVNLVFDFETYEDENGVHIPYLVRSFSHTKDELERLITINNVFYGEDCGLQLLKSLNCNTRLIAHNCNYDYRFLIQYLSNIEELCRGNRLISCKAVFDEYFIELKDSYHLISSPLRKFPATFNLPCEKEVMPYSLYSKETIEKRYISIQNVLDTHIAEEDKEQFLNNIKRWKLEKDGCYDIVEYSSKYCEIDCKILWDGYNTFRKWMLDCVKLDIDNILTIASLSHRYLVRQGCYDGVYEMKGVPQMFIQGCVVGGRTMTSDNRKIKIQEKINDFDAVSLYPSAMSRLNGFLKGKPKIVKNLDYNDLKTKDGYFVDVRINSVCINRAFPLASVKNENGIRLFTNDLVGRTIRVDKTTLEDLIQFQGITFDVIRGYYFDEGFNTKICDTIKYLFQERLNKKKEKNPAQEIYKLIMNSGYGKSIMKPIDTRTRFFDDEEEFNVFLSNHYNWVISYVKFGDKTKVEFVNPLDDHKNIAQVGVCILSMSKRIMNEVMCLAEDDGLDLYYQDTDSIHIKDCDISRLSESFKAKYGRDLIGTKMGQFHSDFDMKGCSNIYARRSIFLGKKSYIDELVGFDNDGNEKVGYHTRMKGIPDVCLKYTSDKLGYSNLYDMYEDLYNGKSIEIDLTNDGSKANFKMRDDYSVETLSMFKRTLVF